MSQDLSPLAVRSMTQGMLLFKAVVSQKLFSRHSLYRLAKGVSDTCQNDASRGGLPMESEHHGYCVQCKKKVLLLEPIEHAMSNSRTHNHHVEMIKGRCPECDRVVYKIKG